ncbi:MAG: hypothetical protein PHQ80_03530 [Candidatus ainarchaeum sp.]|nr:hypothetical protein [Candidatus ainarchaeum sp.]MDD5096382.1 hypothetical protein [Candidatus ainarchaeum sp.]
MRAVKEREEEVPRLSYVPVVSVALQEAEMAAFNVMNDAWRNIFAGRVTDSRIGELATRPDRFEGCSVRYARMGDADIYSVEASLNRVKRVLTLKVSDTSTEMMLSTPDGRQVEYIREAGGEIVVRR